MLKVPCTLMRAGTSKAAFLLKNDLPDSIIERDKLILKLMGSPDLRQIDGIGGGDPLSSKVAIIDKHNGPDADINFLFAQVLLNKPEVNTQTNCGNILSGVAPFAIEKGLVKATHPITKVRIFNENTNTFVVATVQTPNGIVTYEGKTQIDGVPGTSSPIFLDFGNVMGTTTGKLFPTRNVVDVINGISVSCVDCSIPVVFIAANSLGKKGNESKIELDQDIKLLQTIEDIRQAVTKKMNMTFSPLLPKVALVSSPLNGGNIASRYFTPVNCHAAHAVTGAICISVAASIVGTIPNQFFVPSNDHDITIEHPAGMLPIALTLKKDKGTYILEKAGVYRTARPLIEGRVLIRKDTSYA